MTAKKKVVKKIVPRGKSKTVTTSAAILGRPTAKTTFGYDLKKVKPEWLGFCQNLLDLREQLLKQMSGLAQESAQEMAESYLKGDGSMLEKVDALISWQKTKAGTSGFLNGLGGFALMPITIPVNIGSVIYMQVRMIAAIAYIGGYNLKDDTVQALVTACLVGSSAFDILKDVGINIGTKITRKTIEKISYQSMIKPINQKVGFKLITKFGEKGAVNIGKAIPIAGGVVGAVFDVTATHIIGNTAKKLFISIDTLGDDHWPQEQRGDIINIKAKTKVYTDKTTKVIDYL